MKALYTDDQTPFQVKIPGQVLIHSKDEKGRIRRRQGRLTLLLFHAKNKTSFVNFSCPGTGLFLCSCQTGGVVERVLGVLAGNDFGRERLVPWLQAATKIYAADSAADVCIQSGFRPIVVGDMDSVRSDISQIENRINRDQMFSDADKLFAEIRHDGFDSATICGIEGDRLDHVFASFGSALTAGLRTSFVLRAGMAHLVTSRLVLVPRIGSRISVMPLKQSVVSLAGVQWPLDRAPLVLGGHVSLSNRAIGEVTLEVYEGAVVLFTEETPRPGEHRW